MERPKQYNTMDVPDSTTSLLMSRGGCARRFKTVTRKKFPGSFSLVTPGGAGVLTPRCRGLGFGGSRVRTPLTWA